MEGWEEPLHPGSLRRSYPTLSHLANNFARFLPLCNPTVPPMAANKALSRGFPGAAGQPAFWRLGGRAVAKGRTGRVLAGRAGFRRSMCMRWGVVGPGVGRGGSAGQDRLGRYPRGAPGAPLRGRSAAAAPATLGRGVRRGRATSRRGHRRARAALRRPTCHGRAAGCAGERPATPRSRSKLSGARRADVRRSATAAGAAGRGGRRVGRGPPARGRRRATRTATGRATARRAPARRAGRRLRFTWRDHARRHDPDLLLRARLCRGGHRASCGNEHHCCRNDRVAVHQVDSHVTSPFDHGLAPS